MTHSVTTLASTRPFWVWTQGKQPLVAAAIHDGHAVRAEVAVHLALQWSKRRREEDPFTFRWTQIADTRLVVVRSRFDVNAFGLRRSRYLSLAKTRLQHLLTSTAMNIVRMVDWLQGVPHDKTRVSQFTALAPESDHV